MIRNLGKRESFIPIADYGNMIKVSFDYKVIYDTDEEGNKIPSNVGTWYEAMIKPKPSYHKLKTFILDTINKDIDNKILSGFVWRNMPIWLSTENQFNYKAAYDLAVQTNGANLPIVFKFGDTNKPIYYEFKTIEDLTDFYIQAVNYINQTLAEGWVKKDSIDWSEYEKYL